MTAPSRVRLPRHSIPAYQVALAIAEDDTGGTTIIGAYGTPEVAAAAAEAFADRSYPHRTVCTFHGPNRGAGWYLDAKAHQWVPYTPACWIEQGAVR